jgi:hypothetical protein
MSARVRWFVSAVVVVAGIAGLGCENKEKDVDKRDKEIERQDRREREQATGRDRDPDQVIGRSDRGGSRTTVRDVPSTATRVDAGAGPRLNYTPTREGMLYVVDADDQRLVFSNRLRADERFVLDPEDNRATIDGRTVLGTGLYPRRRYTLYFDRAK